MLASIIVPVLDGAADIGCLIEEIYDAVSPAIRGELIVVDDARSDATPVKIRALLSTGRFPNLRYLRHDRPGGQGMAIRSGMLAARHPVIVTLDGAGENDPADIGRLVERLAPPGALGPALVHGVRTRRRASRARLFMAGVGNRIRRAILRDDCPDAGCGIKAFWRDAALLLPFFFDQPLYLAALFKWHGCEVAFVPVNDRPRVNASSRSADLRATAAGIFAIAGVLWLTRAAPPPAIVEDWPEGDTEPQRALARSNGSKHAIYKNT